MIEITLVGGFLGAGKTTWMSHAISHQRASIDVVIVNEFSTDSVDDATLAAASTGKNLPILQIPGGCACCEKLSELRTLLLTLVSQQHLGTTITGTSRGSLHVVLETSGLADPQNIVRLLSSDPVLRRNVRLREVLVILDGVMGESTLRHHALARAQLRLADRVILSRADLVGEDELALAVSLVRFLCPGGQLTLGRNGAEQPWTSPADPVEKSPEWFSEDDLVPSSWTFHLPRRVSWPQYSLWLHALVRAHPQAILRSKGIIWTERGPMLVQTMGSVIASPVAVSTAEATTSMVFITHGIEMKTLARSLAAFVPSSVPAL